MSDKEVIELLKTGNFTIAYSDSGCCDLFKGKYSYSKLPVDKELRSFDYAEDFNGYMPKIVELLIKALGGKGNSV